MPVENVRTSMSARCHFFATKLPVPPGEFRKIPERRQHRRNKAGVRSSIVYVPDLLVGVPKVFT
jgi:hypothetical protein